MNRLLLLLLGAVIINCTGANNPTYDLVRIETPMGEILVKLHDETPVHKASFIKLVNEDYFDSLTFNRVIDNFVAQGGCPDTPEGFSESPYLLKPEFSDMVNVCDKAF